MGSQVKLIVPLGTFLLFLNHFTAVHGLWNCPPDEEIDPAYCLNQMAHGMELDIGYMFYEPTPLPQDRLNNVIPALRKANNLTGDLDWAKIYGLYYKFVAWNPLNLTSFARTRITELYIENNPWLSQISDLPSGRTIGIRSLNLMFCASAGDELVTKFLSALEPGDLQRFQISSGNLSATFLDTRPFDQFPFLEELYLWGNKIGKIGGGQFSNLLRLNKLWLSNTSLTEVGENALWFDDPLQGAGMGEETLTISLDKNDLTEHSFKGNLGLSSIKNRPILLKLDYNNITRVDRALFEEFLYAHKLNKLDLYDNPIFCDNSMKWLKDARAELEPKVVAAKCINDPGKTVFTTDLIS